MLSYLTAKETDPQREAEPGARNENLLKAIDATCSENSTIAFSITTCQLQKQTRPTCRSFGAIADGLCHAPCNALLKFLPLIAMLRLGSQQNQRTRNRSCIGL